MMYVGMALSPDWLVFLNGVVKLRIASIVSTSVKGEVDRVGTELKVESAVSLRTFRSVGGGDIGFVCGNPWLGNRSDPGNSTGSESFHSLELAGVSGGEQ